MSIEDAVVEGLRVLPPDKQLEVLDFVAFLLRCGGAGTPRQYLEGQWPDLDSGITDEDIAQARRELASRMSGEGFADGHGGEGD